MGLHLVSLLGGRVITKFAKTAPGQAKGSTDNIFGRDYQKIVVQVELLNWSLWWQKWMVWSLCSNMFYVVPHDKHKHHLEFFFTVPSILIYKRKQSGVCLLQSQIWGKLIKLYIRAIRVIWSCTFEPLILLPFKSYWYILDELVSSKM